LQKSPSLLLSRNASTYREPDINDELIGYTSLKDIILSSSPPQYAIQEGSDFDSSNITIKNQLVKSAASAYLQSTAVLANRNQNCFAKFWRKLKNMVASSSCWNVHSCFRPIYRFFA
ncbi:hypothetical protein CFOL_v3_18504, partial [Cephalotus follicularis]